MWGQHDSSANLAIGPRWRPVAAWLSTGIVGGWFCLEWRYVARNYNCKPSGSHRRPEMERRRERDWTELYRCFSRCPAVTFRVCLITGRTVTQAVSRRLPTAAARVRAQVRSCGICGGQSGTGAGFLRVLRSPLSIRMPPINPQSSSS
jgi:hypothetical protein